MLTGVAYPLPTTGTTGSINPWRCLSRGKRVCCTNYFLRKQAKGLTGTPMTYSLFEFAKEKADELIVDDPPDVDEPVGSQVLQARVW